MTTAFVLGGGGLLGAHEVGMLRALAEAGIRPDLVVGTSIGALNGAFVAADPSGAAARLSRMWQGDELRLAFSEKFWGRAVRLVRSGTHLHSLEPLGRILGDALPGSDFADLKLPFQCVAAGIETASARWFSSGPVVPAVMASCAVPGLLPPVEIDGTHYFDGGLVDSIPVGRAVTLGASTVYVLQVGRIESPLEVPTRPWEVGLVAFEIARRHRFHEEMSSLPSGVQVHVLPTGGDRPPAGSAQFRHRDQARVGQSIERAYAASASYLAGLTSNLYWPPSEGRGLVLPPRLVRRLVVAPMVICFALALIVLSPLLAVLALLFGLAGLLRAGRMRNLRLVSFAVVWVTAELVALVLLLGLWIVSGFGGRLQTEPYQSRHYRVVRWFLDALYRGAERTYGLRVEIDEPELTGEELVARATRPIIVLSRHAGPGDSILLVHQLLSVYGRRPRIVMKATLQFDPSLDVLGNRLPNVFVKPRQTGESIFTEQIERLARGLDREGALVIFPEGANWTPIRWRRGIRRLEHAGRRDLADRAREMPNLLPPRPGGTLAAIAACPDADVIFVAHVGLDTILSIGDVWRRFPVDQVIRARWWRVPFDRVPREADHEEQLQWLYGWWERIDSWITANRPGVPAVPAAVAAPSPSPLPSPDAGLADDAGH
jgi:predicted acylesterase/phospholipase RssA/1-acyl-sn-glycerol-3-phosphate acyltransferase